MEQIAPFDEAVAGLRRFLRAEGYPDRITWAFRDDFYSIGTSRHRVAWPLPTDNEVHAQRLFRAGQSRGLVELEALFHVGDHCVATVIAPRPDEIHGWSHGLKLAIRSPFVGARPVSFGLAWFSHRVRSAYRRFQRFESFVPRRRSIAA